MHAVSLNKMIHCSITIQDIFLKFSPVDTHKSVINWRKNLGCCATDMSATPLFVSKVCEGVAPTVFEMFSKNFFWWGSRPISLTQWQEFQIYSKKWRFQIFGASRSIQRKLSNPWLMGPLGKVWDCSITVGKRCISKCPCPAVAG